jgi:hypothetical protein
MWPITNKIIRKPVTAIRYFLPREEQNKLRKRLIIKYAVPYSISFRKPNDPAPQGQ